MAIVEAFVTQPVLTGLLILGIVIAAVIAVFRGVIRWMHAGRFHGDDYALFASVALYIAMNSVTLWDLNGLYELLGVATSTVGITFMQLEIVYRHVIVVELVDLFLFWTTLWAVKLSLLLSFRRMLRLTNWLRVWWVLLAFCIITWLGCMTTAFTSCKDPSQFLVLGVCERPDNHVAQIASLYLTFAADVATDLVIMILPIRVIWGLQIPKREKWVLAGLFGSQGIAIIIAAIRVFLIVSRASTLLPSPTWICLWNSIECMTSIFTGCVPAFSQVFRNPDRFGLRLVGQTGRRLLPRTWFGRGGNTNDTDTANSHAPYTSTVTHGRPRMISELSKDPIFGILAETEITVKSEKMQPRTEPRRGYA